MAFAWKDHFVWFTVAACVFGVIAYYNTVSTDNTNIAQIENVALVGCNMLLLFVGMGMWSLQFKGYVLSSLAMVLLTNAYAFLIALPVKAFFDSLFLNEWLEINLDDELGMFAQAAVLCNLIALGANWGKLNATQYLIYTSFVIPAFALLSTLVHQEFIVADYGGGMTIHLFGAVIGISSSYILGNRQELGSALGGGEAVHPKSGILSTIGFLIVFATFPLMNMVNSNNATHTLGEPVFFMTLLGAFAAVIAAYAFSRLIRGPFFSFRLVQNSFLAGVIFMAGAHAMVDPAYAVLLGSIAGFVIVVAEFYLAPLLQRASIHDSRGVFLLHGVMGLCAGLASTFYALTTGKTVRTRSKINAYPGLSARTNMSQAAYEMYTVLTAIGLGLLVGIVVGFFMKVPYIAPASKPSKHFSDNNNFTRQQVNKLD